MQATRFYQRLGFHVVGEPFTEAGIAHCKMLLRLNDSAIVANSK
jgi:predicted GNAT family N-acyltransferase